MDGLGLGSREVTRYCQVDRPTPQTNCHCPLGPQFRRDDIPRYSYLFI